MHEMNEDIDSKLRDMSEDSNSKIKNVTKQIEALQSTMDSRLKEMTGSILEQIRNTRRTK